ncbi:hypothetical protein DFJ77DRAFT_461843 [Powellomyces hirtus]|nr:hypothetical protein DFJ77DRAFT_461843 [Powellomyces hirtus]
MASAETVLPKFSATDIPPQSHPYSEDGGEDGTKDPSEAPEPLPQLEFTKAIDHRRLTQPRTALDSEIHDAAIKALAAEFLNVPDLDLELRAYMVETTLPTLIFALEKLLREAEKRSLVERDGAGGGGKDPSVVELKPSREMFGGKDGATAPAADGLPPQPDKPQDQFDSINWLAQFLYRNNPRFSNFATSTSSPYAQSLQSATETLKDRLFELEDDRRAKVRADEMQRRQDEDRAMRIRSAQVAERHRSFHELLGTVFKKWTAKLWRPQPGYVLQSEMLDVYKQVFRTESLQTNPELMMKVSILITALTPTTRPESALASSIASLTSESGHPSSPPDTHATTPAAGSTSSTQHARSLTTKRYIDDFVASHTVLTESWTMDDLTIFLKELSGQLDRKGEDIKDRFANAYYMPHWTSNSATTREEWMERLAESLKHFTTDHEEVDVGRLRSEYERFCAGELDLSVMTAVGATESRPGTGSVALDASSHSLITPGSASSGRPSTGGTSLKPLGEDESSGDGSGGSGGSVTDGVMDAERSYRIFTRHLVADLGIDAAEAFMNFLSKTVGAEEAKMHAENNVAEDSTQPPPAPQVSEARISQAGALYNALQSLDSTADNADVLVSTLTSVADRALADVLGDSPLHAALSEFHAAVTSGSWSTTITDAISRPDFVQHLTTHFGKDFSDDMYTQAIAALSNACTAIAEIQAEKRRKADTEAAAAADPPAVDRTPLERAAIASIAALGAHHDTNVSQACTQALEILTSTLSQFHSEHTFRGRVSLLEQSITKAAPDGTISKDAVGTFLRFVAVVEGAAREDVRKTVFGKMVAEDGLEQGVMESGGVVKVAELQKAGGSDPFVNPTTGEDDQGVNRYLGLPLKSPNGRSVGVLSLNLLGPSSDFLEADISFLSDATTALLSAITRISTREKAMILAHAARRWCADQSEADVEVFLPEDPISVNDPPMIFRLDDFVSPDLAERLGILGRESPYMRPRSSRMVRMQEEDLESGTLLSATTSPSPVSITDSEGRTSTFVPVTDPSGHCIAVMRVKPRPPSLTVTQDDMDEITRTLRILGTALTCISQEKFAEGGVIADTGSLDAENIDENARRHLLFPKLMLLSARSALSKLDNKMLSELRSYRKPPATIHKVIKGVLYLFGKTPQEVAKWSDCTRLINMDLLKKMIDYDPTAIQKKLRFQRVKRVLKSIPHGDVRKRGSIPAQSMSDWLVVSVDLRDQALKRRKSRADVFKESTAETEEVEEEEEAEEAEEVDAEGGEEGEMGSLSRLGTAEGDTTDGGVTHDITVSGGGAGGEEKQEEGVVEAGNAG